MAVCRLPLEIPEAIIDYLHNDRESLYACSLTCKDWIPRSRSYIFSSVTLDNFDGKWAGSGRVKRSLLKFLNAILSSTQPGRYVCSLTLRFHLRDYSWTQERPALPILAENLSSVRELQLTSIRWDMLDTAGRTAVLSGFQTVQKLTLDEGSFGTFTEILELILSFPALESLACNVDSVVVNPEDLPAHLKPPSLRKLQLEGCTTSQIMAWFTSGESKCDIPNVEVVVTAAHELMDVFEFLKALGPTVKHLHLAVSFSYKLAAWDIDAEAVDLTQNTSLLSLRISREFHATKRTIDAYLEYLSYIPLLLSQIRSSDVESLWIDLRITPQIRDENLDAHAWSDIEHTLSHPRFSHLRNLTFFNHSSEVNVENLRNHVSQKMPRLAAREILHFYEGYL